MQPQSEKGKDINEDYIDLLDYLSCILRNYKIFTFSFLIIISFGIYKILNWKPTFDLDKGLIKTIEYFKNTDATN